MKIEDIRIKGMHCDACEKTIIRALTKAGITVERISYAEGRARISHEGIDRETIASVLNEKGYLLEEVSEADAPVIHRHVVQRADVIQVEKGILAQGLLMLGLLLAAQSLLALSLYPLAPGYRPGQFLLFLCLPVVIVMNAAMLWHQHAYLHEVSGATGMLVGTTFGVTAGLPAGVVIGSVNGLLVGMMVGTLAGAAAGAYAGKRAGTFGILQGMIAGLLSGIAGAMIAALVSSGHIVALVLFLVAACAALLAVLMRLVLEVHAGDISEVRPWPFAGVLGFSFALMLMMSAIMLFIPGLH